jgi:hypothetical protein
VLEAHIDCPEQFHSACQLSADPAAHEKASEDKTYNATKLIGEDDQESGDEEGISGADTLREGECTAIG